MRICSLRGHRLKQEWNQMVWSVNNLRCGTAEAKRWVQKKGCIGAEGGIRTPTPYGATPSRWCVCQFRHFRTRKLRKNYQYFCARANNALPVTSMVPV